MEPDSAARPARRRPGRLRRFLLRPLVWALALLAIALFLLLTPWGRDWLAGRARTLAEARLAEGLGRRVTIGQLELSLVPLGLEARDLAVAAADPLALPAIEVARVAITARLIDLFEPSLALGEVVIERPRLRLIVDGRDDFPRWRRRAGAGESRLAIAIGSLTVRDGWFSLDERQVPLDVEASGVVAELLPAGAGVQGEARVAAAALLLPKSPAPYRAAVEARLRLERDRVVLSRVAVDGPDLAANLTGEVHWREDDFVHLEGEVETSAEFFRTLGYLELPFFGEAQMRGRFDWRPRSWQVEGEVSAAQLKLWSLDLSEVSGRLAIDRERALFEVARSDLGGGQLQGRVEFEPLAGATRGTIDLRLAAVPLDYLLGRVEVELGEPLAAVADGSFRYGFALADGERGDGRVELAVRSPAERAGFPLAGALDFAIAGGRLESESFALGNESTDLVAWGSYDLAGERGEFSYRVNTERLGELARLLPLERDPAAPDLWLPSAGSGALEGALVLEPAGASSRVRLALADVDSPGLAAPALSGVLAVDRRGFESLHLEAARPGATLTIAGRVPFAEPAAGQAGLDLAIESSGWPFAAAAPWLPFSPPVAGPTYGSVRLRGSFDALSGEVEATVRPAEVAGLEASALGLRLRLAPERIAVERLEIDAPAGALVATGEVALPSGALDLDLAATPLDLSRAPFGSAATAPESIAGRLALSGRLTGTAERPALALLAEASGVALAGQAVGPDGSGRLTLDWRDGQLEVDGSLPGLLSVRGGGALGWERADLAFDLASDDLPALVAFAGGDRALPLAGGVAAKLNLTGDLFGDGALAARLTAPALDFELAGHRLRGLEPAIVDLAAEAVTIRSLYLGEAGGAGELFLSGRLGLAAPGALDLRLQATLDAAWLTPALQPLALRGRLEALAAVRGTLAEPKISGQAELADASLLLPDFPHSLENLRAVLLFYPDRLVLDSLRAGFAAGTLEAGGTLEWPRAGRELDYRFQLALRRASLRYPAGWLLRGDADLALVSQPGGRLLRGDIVFDRAYYLQDLPANIAQLISRFLERQRLQAATTEEPLASTALNLAIKAPRALRVRNNLADLRGSAELSVRGTLAQPVLFGRAEAESGGRIVYSGTDYRVERARLTFANPLRIEPLLDLEARTKVQEYEVTLGLAGTVDRLTARFSSDPPLSDLDVLSLLSTGQTVAPAGAVLPAADAREELAGSSSVGAEGFLYNQAASLLSSRFESLFRLDKLRIDPLASSRDVVSSARVTVGKRLSRRLYVTYSVDPSTSEQQQVQVEWQVGSDLVLVLTQNGSESYAVDLRWERRF